MPVSVQMGQSYPRIAIDETARYRHLPVPWRVNDHPRPELPAIIALGRDQYDNGQDGLFGLSKSSARSAARGYGSAG